MANKLDILRFWLNVRFVELLSQRHSISENISMLFTNATLGINPKNA